MIDINSKELGAYFTVVSPTELKDKETGYVIRAGNLNFYLAYGGDAYCGLTYLGRPRSNEQGVPGKAGCSIQHYERGILAYDPKHQLDSPPGAGDVYLMHVETAPPAPTPAPETPEPAEMQQLRDRLKQIEALASI